MELARARLEEAEANVGIAQTTADRLNRLVNSGAVAPQLGDDARAVANSAVAAVATRKAELRRLQVLNGYERIVAPFDGRPAPRRAGCTSGARG